VAAADEGARPTRNRASKCATRPNLARRLAPGAGHLCLSYSLRAAAETSARGRLRRWRPDNTFLTHLRHASPQHPAGLAPRPAQDALCRQIVHGRREAFTTTVVMPAARRKTTTSARDGSGHATAPPRTRRPFSPTPPQMPCIRGTNRDVAQERADQLVVTLAVLVANLVPLRLTV
jgi:hypothetical protein